MNGAEKRSIIPTLSEWVMVKSRANERTWQPPSQPCLTGALFSPNNVRSTAQTSHASGYNIGLKFVKHNSHGSVFYVHELRTRSLDSYHSRYSGHLSGVMGVQALNVLGTQSTLHID